MSLPITHYVTDWGGHKRIIAVVPIANTRAGYWADLECGHRVLILGNIAHVKGVALCTECRDSETGK